MSSCLLWWQFACYRLHRLLIVPNFVFTFQSFNLPPSGLYVFLLLLLVWTILSHSYRLIQEEIVRPQVLLDSLHPCISRTSWWSPAVFRRGSSYDTPGICLVCHSCNVAEQRKTPCLDNSRQAWLPGCPSHQVRPMKIFLCQIAHNTCFGATIWLLGVTKIKQYI